MAYHTAHMLKYTLAFVFVSLTVLMLNSAPAPAMDGSGGDSGSFSDFAIAASVSYAGTSDTPAPNVPIERTMKLVSANETGLSLTLNHPLSTGETQLSFADLGRRTAALIHTPAAETAGDAAILISSVLENFDLTEYTADDRVKAFTKPLQPVRTRLVYPDLLLNETVLLRARHLYVALILLKIHNELHADVADARLTEIVARRVHSFVRKVLYRRDLITSYPSDEQLVRVLVGLAHRPEASSPRVWAEAVKDMTDNLAQSLESELVRRQVAPELRWIGGGAGLAAVGGGFALAFFGGSVDPEVARYLPMAWIGGIVASGLGSTLAYQRFLEPRRMDRARTEVTEFVKSCERALRPQP